MIANSVNSIIERTINGLGYEFVGAEMVSQRHSKLLRVYIDSADGVQIDDCVIVSNQLSGVLDVEDPIQGKYQLEVSSPGVERPLFKLEDYQRFKGHQAFVELYEANSGKRKIKGDIEGVKDNTVLILEPGSDEPMQMKLSEIRKAHLLADLKIGRN
ncbi:MAG: ribosome maturation factor RimP [Gammaproteobacteria bacterium]|nr:ribosome maturation factor RimP [Gammaproteobacteria bacterium]